jgi:hypothetical protein
MHDRGLQSIRRLARRGENGFLYVTDGAFAFGMGLPMHRGKSAATAKTDLRPGD